MSNTLRVSGVVMALARLYHPGLTLIGVLVQASASSHYFVQIGVTNYRLSVGDNFTVRGTQAFWTPANPAHLGSVFDVVGLVQPVSPEHNA